MKTRIKTTIAIACAAYVGISSSSFAQSNSANAKTDEIIVTAKGLQSVGDIINTAHVFTEQDITAAQVKSIPALLERIGGISISDSGGRGSATGVFVRGISSSQTIVLIDGVRVGSATLGAAALNSYPVEAIERIEVLKGPFSGIYGADAVGGVIQLFTKKGGTNDKVIAISAGSDSLGEASIALGFGNERNSLHISAQREETDGIDRTSIVTGGNDDRDGFEETAVSIGGQLTLTDSTVAKLTILATESDVDFDNTFGTDIGNVTDNETLSTALNVTHQFSEVLTWSTTLGINEDEANTTSSFPSTFITNRDSIGTELQYQVSDSTVITAGLDYYEEDIESTTDFPVTERDNSAAFVQLQTGTGAFDLVASLRTDDNSAYDTETNGSLALAYQFNENLRASVSYGTAFVAPSFNFLFFPFFGNPDILPEESENVEVSLSGNVGVTSWRVSAYQNDVENLFSFDPSTFLAANIGEAELRGIEVEVNTVLYDWRLGIHADVLDTEDQLTGAQLDDRHEQSLSINASRSYGDLDLNFDFRSETGRVDAGGTDVAGYGLFDVSAAYKINDNVSVLANIDNVFDKDYTVNLVSSTQRFNTEGRQAKITLRYAF